VLRLRSAGWLVANQVVAAGVAFVISVLVARALGPSGKGTVTVAQTIAGLAGIILAVGLPGAAGYLAAKGRVDGRTESRVAWSVSLLATGVTLAVAIPLQSRLTDVFFTSDSSAYLWLAILAIAPTIAAQVLAGFLLGVGRARAMTLVSMGTGLANLAGIVALDAAGHLTPRTFLVLWLTLLFAGALIQTVMLLRMPASPKPSSVIGTLRAGARFGAASWASSGLHLLALRIDILLLGAIAGAAAVGVYSIGVTVAEVGWFVPNALYGVLFPKTAAEGIGSKDLVAQTARTVWPVVLVVGLCLVGVAELLVLPLYGSGFVGAVGVVTILVPGMTTGAVSTVLSAYLAGTGLPGLATAAATINVTSNVLLCALLIPPFGYSGAAAASSVSYSLAAVATAYFFLRKARLPLASVLLPRRSDFSGALVQVRGRIRRTG
jgi:O-antigen/teichoic acid export membrane protein